MNNPRTIEEARKVRYGYRRRGYNYAYKEGCCVYAMGDTDDYRLGQQCSRKNGHGPGGLYCKQHAKKVSGE